jgi:hypothetical protein
MPRVRPCASSHSQRTAAGYGKMCGFEQLAAALVAMLHSCHAALARSRRSERSRATIGDADGAIVLAA